MSKFFLGIEFKDEIYKKLVEDYSEAFTHSSLDIELEFLKLEKYTLLLKSLLKDNKQLYESLTEKEKIMAIDKYHYFITYMAYYKGMIPKIDFENQKEINKTYSKYFSEFDKYLIRLLIFDENKKVNINETGKNISIFFPNYIERKPTLKRAQDSRKNHIEAFKYALENDNIGINEILKINEIITRSNPDRQLGWKKINNVITGADFQTMKKEEIPNQIAELLRKYQLDYSQDIKDPNEEGITDKEKYERIYIICLNEAKFHIAFEHIHPFADGNGRTGRIIMSTNLLKKNITPPLLTKSMIKKYKEYINNYDYEGLAQMIMDSSSQLFSTWVSINRDIEGIAPNEIINNKAL